MIKACFACGAEKDLNIETVYPYSGDCLADDIPMPQLHTVECRGTEDLPSGGWNFRMCVFCHECWHRLEISGGIDMWISQARWESLKPMRTFASLPKVHPLDDTWEAELYE